MDAIWVYGREYTPEELLETVAVDAPFFQEGGGVTFSGGECLAQPEFALEAARLFRACGIGVYVDTCGFVTRDVLAQMIPYTDKFLYDVKAIDDEVHKKCTGQSNRSILENLAFLCEQGCNVEVRIPLVKGWNDGECEAMADTLAGLAGISKVKVLQYHAFAGSRYEALGLRSTLPATKTTMEDMERAVKILRSRGLNAVNGALDD